MNQHVHVHETGLLQSWKPTIYAVSRQVTRRMTWFDAARCCCIAILLGPYFRSQICSADHFKNRLHNNETARQHLGSGIVTALERPSCCCSMNHAPDQHGLRQLRWPRLWPFFQERVLDSAHLCKAVTKICQPSRHFWNALLRQLHACLFCNGLLQSW